MYTVDQKHIDTLEILRRVLLHIGPADGAFGENANGRGYLIDTVCPNRDYPTYQIRECLPFDMVHETPRVARIYDLPNDTTQIIFEGFKDLSDILNLIPENISI